MIDAATQEIKTTLSGITTYGGTPTVELERLVVNIGDRYPYILVIGPFIENEPQFYNTNKATAEYNILYYPKYGDEDLSRDPVTYVTRNVANDIVKALMADVTRGGNVINTSIKNYGNSFEIMGGNAINPQGSNKEFLIYVIIECEYRTDSTDPSLVG